MDIAMVGLGRMGGNMARRLLRGGHRVVVWNRTYAKSEELASEGAEAVHELADVVAEAHAHHAASVRPQSRQVAARLGALEHAEAVRLARDIDIVGVVPQELQEQTLVWPALVKLARGVQVARAVAQRRRELEAVAHLEPERLQAAPDLVARRHVGLQGDVIAG